MGVLLWTSPFYFCWDQYSSGLLRFIFVGISTPLDFSVLFSLGSVLLWTSPFLFSLGSVLLWTSPFYFCWDQYSSGLLRFIFVGISTPLDFSVLFCWDQYSSGLLRFISLGSVLLWTSPFYFV